MATMITGRELKDAVLSRSLIQGGAENCIEGIKYDFRLSNHILKAKFGQPVDVTKFSQDQFLELIIEPNEVVFVLSEERLTLPINVVAQLSPKRKLSQSGVITMGGLAIDPGYNGKLLIGLLNISSTPFNLRPGKKLIAATFYKLDESEMVDVRACCESLDDFPDELVDVMQKYNPVGVKSIFDQFLKLQNEITAIKQELADNHDWRQRLDRHDEQISNILRGLETEKQAREKGEDEFTKAITGLNRTFATIKGGAMVLYALLALLLLPVLYTYIPKFLNLFK